MSGSGDAATDSSKDGETMELVQTGSNASSEIDTPVGDENQDAEGLSEGEEALVREYHRFVLAYEVQFLATYDPDDPGKDPKLLCEVLYGELRNMCQFDYYLKPMKVASLEESVKDFLCLLRESIGHVPGHFNLHWLVSLDTKIKRFAQGDELWNVLQDAMCFEARNTKLVDLEDHCRYVIYFLKRAYRDKDNQAIEAQMQDIDTALVKSEKANANDLHHQDTIDKEERVVENLYKYALAYATEASQRATHDIADEPLFIRGFASHLCYAADYDTSRLDIGDIDRSHNWALHLFQGCEKGAQNTGNQYDLEWVRKLSTLVKVFASDGPLHLKVSLAFGKALKEAIDYSVTKAPGDCKLKKQCRLMIRYLSTAYRCKACGQGASFDSN